MCHLCEVLGVFIRGSMVEMAVILNHNAYSELLPTRTTKVCLLLIIFIKEHDIPTPVF